MLAKKSFIAERTPFVNGLASMRLRVSPALARSVSSPIAMEERDANFMAGRREVPHPCFRFPQARAFRPKECVGSRERWAR